MFCHKCGSEIKRINNTYMCNVCGAHIYGYLDYRTSDDEFAVTKGNRRIHEDYYNSFYYRYTQEPLENVIADKGSAGEYAVEGWITGMNRQDDLELLSYPYYIFSDLIIPEPDGSFQEIDMVVLTQRNIYVIEVKNRSGKLELKRWSDTECTIDGRETYSPVMQNENHIIALSHYLTKNLPEDSYIPFPVNIVATSPLMESVISFDDDAYDDLVMFSRNWAFSKFHLLAKEINKIEDLCSNIQNRINLTDYWNVLAKCCNYSKQDKALQMRFREEHSQNPKKHPWEYYECEYDGEPYLVRHNGVYIQVYNDTYNYWELPLDYAVYREAIQPRSKITGIRNLMDAVEKIRAGEFVTKNVPTAAPEMITCPNCGKQYSPMKFCPHCGYYNQ